MTEPKKRRTVKQLIATIQASVARDVGILNKESSELAQATGKLNLLSGMLLDTKNRYDSAEIERRDCLVTYRTRAARVEAMRDLLKDFEKNGVEE